MGYGPTVNAIAGVFLIGLIGYVSVRRRILTHAGVEELSRVLVDFILPATLFHAMFTQFSPSEIRYVGLAGGAQILFFVTGVSCSALLARLVKVRSDKGTMAVLCSFQNNVYLPLPICMAVLPAAQALRAQFYIGCFVLFFSVLLWTLGVIMLAGRDSLPASPLSMLRKVLNPPFVATLAGMVAKLVCIALEREMPGIILDVTQMVGAATTPLAMIVLGALLAEVQWERDFELKAITIISVTKLLVIPFVGLVLVVWVGRFEPLFAFVVLLQAASPPATNLSIVAKRYGGNTSFVALSLFSTYILCLATIPFWLSLLR